jgi:hypothetical protein
MFTLHIDTFSFALLARLSKAIPTGLFTFSVPRTDRPVTFPRRHLPDTSPQTSILAS